MGIPEERACRRAHVSRETLRKYERGDFIPTRTKRQRLDALYGGWRAELAWSVEVGHTVEEDDEMSPRDMPGEPPESGTLPAEVRAA